MGYNTLRPCVFKSPAPIYPDEVFVYVNNAAIPDGFNHHLVSNYGRVYDYRKNEMCILHPDSKGYLYIIAAYNSEKKYPRVHRIALASFNYVPGCEDGKVMLVNHIDGNKMNNHISNLEWTDYSGNAKHAYATGLINNKQGEDRVNSKITNDQARTICEMLQNGTSTADISNYTGVGATIIRSIREHRAWNSISCDYTFPECKTSIFSEDDAINICELLISINKYNDESYNDYYRRVLSAYGMPTDINYVEAVRHIHRGKTYKNISSNYNFD